MSTISLSTESLSPGILSVLPIFYVAWSDGILSPTEMNNIRKKLKTMEFLESHEVEYLMKYTDPTSVPSEEIFSSWVQQIRSYGNQLPPKERASLAQLGLDIALAMSHDENTWLSSKTQQSIHELEKALGVDQSDSRALLVSRFSTEEEMLAVDGDIGFSVSELHHYLEGENKDMRDRLRALLSDPTFTKKHIADKESYRVHILNQCQVLARQGYGQLALPEYAGGMESMKDYASVFELLAHYDGSLAVKYGVQFGLFALSIKELGTEAQHKEYLPAASQLDIAGCFAMTETGHGSNVRGLETTATLDKDTDEWIIHTPHDQARKDYIGNALQGDMAVVFAQLIIGEEKHGVHAFIVPLVDEQKNDLPNIKREDCGYKIGLNGVDNGRLYFNHVRIPRDHLLSKYGSVDSEGNYTSPIKNPSKRFFTMLGTLVGGRICVARAGLASTKNALTIAIKYGNGRRQFAPKNGEKETLLLDYPSHQHRLLPLLAKAYGLHFALEDLTQRYIIEGESNKKIETLAAAMKVGTTWFARDAIQECREACGGAGYLLESGIGQLRSDTDIFSTFEGDNTVLLQLVAKGLLSEFKKNFHDEGFRAVFSYLMKRASTSLSEKNLWQVRKTDAEHLLDPEFHSEAFRFREKHLLHTVSQRMRKYLKKRVGPYEAFLRCQMHMIHLAEAYVDRRILKGFHVAIQDAPESTRDVLRLLSEVYALHTIMKERAYFLEHGYMEGVKTKAIRRVLRQRLSVLRDKAEGLVDAWGIPSACLDSVLV